MKVIKAFRHHPDGQPHFLFHGNVGSTKVPLDKWIKADEKQVSDGSGTTLYTSGFHAFLDEETLKEWQKTVITKYVIAEVEVKYTRKKSHSRHKGVILAKRLFVSSKAWKKALKEWSKS